MIIKNFKLDRDKDIYALNKDLMYFINTFVLEKEFNLILNYISRKLNLSLETLRFEVKICLFKNFVNNKGIFNKRLSFFYSFYYFFLLFFFFFYVFFFSKNKFLSQTCDIIIDDIDANSDILKFEILNKKKKLIFFSNVEFSQKGFSIFFFKFRGCIIKKNFFFFIINLVFKTFILNIKNNNNYNLIILYILKNYIKYSTLFQKVKSKYLLQERFYNTSAIKDELFHQNGGIYTSVLQKNIFQINGPGMYIHADILFSLGLNSAQMVGNLGGKIKKIIPIGSFWMERDFYFHPYKNKFPCYDLMFFESDHLAQFHSGYNSYYNDYYEHFYFIRKFAIKFPTLKIAIKHKKNFNDINELKILSDIKNVKYIVDSYDHVSDSYCLGYKAKSLFTWSSTLGYELVGLGKVCYFLDPKNNNFSFLNNKQSINELLRVTSYEEFERNVLRSISGHIDTKIIKNKELYCLKSNDCSDRIISTFNLI